MMKRITSLVCALLLVPALAAAEPTTPEGWYKEGETQYNLGNFQGAVNAFKEGFALETNNSKKAAYLYNIAQSYRMDKDCSNAQFFYKRFLALRDQDPSKPLSQRTRSETEEHIKKLEECVRQQEAIRREPPDQNLKPDGGSDLATPDPAPTPTPPEDKEVGLTAEDDGEEEEDEEEDGIVATASGTGPRLISARLAGGGAKLNAGDLDVPIQATGALIAGYPIALNDKTTIEVGAAFTFTPVPFESTMTGSSGTAQLIGLVANAGVTYAVAPKIGLRGDLGLGALFFSGASGSPFTSGAEINGGALTMFHVRVGVSADYAITPNIVASVMPAFSYSPPKENLSDDITSITAIDFMVGLGYRM